MTFADLIAPLTVDDFIRRYLGRNFLLARVQQSMWQPPVTWPELSAALSAMRVSGERLRIVKDGKNVDPEKYLHHAGGKDGATIRAGLVASLLSDGATLVVNQADELMTNVRHLADSVEQVFRISVGANLYAGWRTTKGFDLHWDDHDTLIVHVIGRKHWTVYEPTREHPIRDDKTGAAAPPTPSTPPVFEGLLTEGDVLYMPRGWWHVARPIDEASVHLTIGMSHPTGADLMKWLMDGLHEHVEIRMPVPHLQDRETKSRYIAALRERVVRALSDDVLERLMDRLDQKDCKRVPLELPVAVEGSVLNSKTTRMRLAAARRLTLSAGPSGFAVFQVNGSPWECDPRLGTALALLDPHQPRGLEELLAVTPSELRPVLKAMLVTMTKTGAIVLEGRQDVEEAREERSRNPVVA